LDWIYGVGYSDDSIEGHEKAVLKAAGVREADPSLRVDADVVLARPASGAAPARPDVIHNHVRPGFECARWIGIEDLPAYLVARKVWQVKFCAERHLPTSRFDVAEAHAARQHLDEGMAGAKLGFWYFDPFKGCAVFGYGHRPH
jgi:hypothetical protein